jgi:hypothetical protein
MVAKPFECGIADHPDAAGACNENRGFEDSAFLHPMCASHVAIAISCKETSENGASIVLAAREYGRDARANRPLSAYQRTVAGY